MGANTKVQRSLLVSAARTASTACLLQADAVQQFVRLYLNVTAASGTGGLQPQIRGYDKISGAAVAISTGGVAVIATGLYVYEFVQSANVAAGAVKESLSRFLPVQWDVQVVHGDASSYTYSLSCEVAPAG